MKKKDAANAGKLIKPDPGALFDRVASILDQARANVVRAVNSNMVIAYWLIGREIVQELQAGTARAAYGIQLVKDLSAKLTERYGRGFSTTNLWYFRQFYLAFSDREPQILHTICGVSTPGKKLHKACGVSRDLVTTVERPDNISGFSSSLSWSHYRTLTKVTDRNERLFYEIEAEKENWSVPHLERQIHTFLFARLLKSRNKKGLMALTKKGQDIQEPIDAIKHPYVLDFLNLPDGVPLHESDLESAIMDKLQPFLLELGKGFAFVGRQHRVETEAQHFYIDLVFYNYHLKCFMLIDLKIGKLTHQDIGQMDMYVRMFDDLRRGPEDNPTVGLILCAEKDEIVARYSVLNDSRQLFASKYMLYLPSEKELALELGRKHRPVSRSKKS
ncbi:MAG TPA: PDDEXK nuclease domain-containing protein [bacterium]|nr:PDDEXK nuclease domain-containing protein [bacterium]